MSAFGNWWVSTRNAVEAELEQAAIALEPTVKAALVSSVQAGVQAGLATTGTAADRFNAALAAATKALEAQGATVGAALLQAAVTAEIGVQSAPTAEPAQ